MTLLQCLKDKDVRSVSLSFPPEAEGGTNYNIILVITKSNFCMQTFYQYSFWNCKITNTASKVHSRCPLGQSAGLGELPV